MQKYLVLKFSWLLILSILAPTWAGFTADQAMAIAAQEISITSSSAMQNSWKADAIVTRALPLFLDGIADVSYWECKVVQNGSDAGFIIVNANQTDIILPESCPSGPTPTEEFAAAMPISGKKIFRYGPEEYIAVDLATNKVVAEMNMAHNAQSTGKPGVVIVTQPIDFASFPGIADFRKAVISAGCYPSYTIDQLKTAYADIGLAKQAITPTREVYLKNYLSFPSTSSTKKYYTPTWYQIKIGDGYAIGCANTAWAIVYGYWRQFKGKDQLFDGYALSSQYVWLWGSKDQAVAQCMKDCFCYCKTTGICLNHNALTLPFDLPKGIQYAESKGYVNGSYCHRHEHRDVLKNFDCVFNEISNDRPVILLIAEGSFGPVPDHYVVIEGAQTKSDKSITLPPTTFFQSSSNNGMTIPSIIIKYPEMRYWVNWGAGDTTSRWWAAASLQTFDHYVINVGGFKQFAVISDKQSGIAPVMVSFEGINRTGEVFDDYVWDFGDGETSNGISTQHTFKKPGNYTVKLQALRYSSYSDDVIATLDVVQEATMSIKVAANMMPVVNLLLGY